MESPSEQASHLSDPPSWKLPIFLGMGAALWGVLTWRPTPTGIWHDDGVYLLIAKSLANGDGLRYAGVVGTPLAAKFPPLYSLVLAPFWVIGDDLAAGSGWLAALNVVFLGIAVAVFARALSQTFGLPAIQVAVVSIVAWISPSLWSLAAIPLSEPLFLLGSVLVLATSRRLFQPEERPNAAPAVFGRAGIAFLAAFTLAYHTRTIAIALLAGCVAALLLRRRWRQALAMGALGAGVMMPWMMWSAKATSSIEPSLQDLLGSYGGWLFSQAAAAPELYRQQVASNVTVLTQSLVTTMVPHIASPWIWVAGGILAVTLVAGARRVWTTNPLWCLYPLAYLGVLVLWPYRSSRLLAPILPILASLVAIGAFHIHDRLRTILSTRRIPTTWALVAGVAACWLIGSGLWTTGSGEFLHPYMIRARTLARTVEAVEKTAPEDAIIGAPELWAAIHLHTGRTVLPSARFRPLSTDGPPWGTPRQQYEMWQFGKVDHLLVEHGGNVHGTALDEVDAACRPGTIEVLASFPGPSHLVRLDLDAPCWTALLGGRS